jgi:hypothetical protein
MPTEAEDASATWRSVRLDGDGERDAWVAW